MEQNACFQLLITASNGTFIEREQEIRATHWCTTLPDRFRDPMWPAVILAGMVIVVIVLVARS